jgi:hypothetical protein
MKNAGKITYVVTTENATKIENANANKAGQDSTVLSTKPS